MKSYIDLLWQDAEFIDTTTNQQKELLKNANIVREKLEASFNPEQMELFQEYYRNISEFGEITETQAFKLGFSYGTKLTSEAFLFSPDKD